MTNQNFSTLPDAIPKPENRDLLMSMRKAYLEVVDAIERELQIKPTTAEIRQLYRSNRVHGNGANGGVDNNQQKV